MVVAVPRRRCTFVAGRTCIYGDLCSLCYALVQALLPVILRTVARFAARVVAGGPAATAATILHRAGALPRDRGLERLLVRGDDVLDDRAQED